MGGSRPNTEQKPGSSTAAAGVPGPSVGSFSSGAFVMAPQNAATTQVPAFVVAAQPADSLETPLEEGYTRSDLTASKASPFLNLSIHFA